MTTLAAMTRDGAPVQLSFVAVMRKAPPAPWLDKDVLLDATQPKGRRCYYWKSEYLPGIEADLLAKLRERFSTGGTYVNFLTEEETGERLAAAYGQNLERLAEIQARWDPDNVFRMNKNIPPSARYASPYAELRLTGEGGRWW